MNILNVNLEPSKNRAISIGLISIVVLSLLAGPVGIAAAETDYTLDSQAPSTVAPGSSFNVTYTLNNTGTTNLSSLALEISGVSEGLEVTAVSSEHAVFISEQQEVGFPTVEPGENVTAEFTVEANASVSGNLSLEAEAINGFGEDQATRIDPTVVTVNTPPSAKVGDDQIVPENTTVELNATSSTDPNGDALSYTWTQTGGPTVDLTNNETATPSFTAPDVGADTTLTFEVAVSDGNGGSDTDTVNLTVEQVNQPPTASAGDNQSVNESTTVTLSASGSDDPDGDTLNYSWTQTSGPSIELSDSEAESPEFTAPTVSSPTDLVFQLEVTDGNGGSDTDTTTLTVGAVNEPPTVDAGPDQEVDEEAEVQLNASNTSDPDGDVVMYAWEQISGPSVTLSDDLSEAPNFTASEVNTDTTLAFEVTARDGNGGTDTDTVNITVLATNDAPVADAGSDQMVNATETVQLDGTGSSDPNADDLNYTWSQVAGPSVELSESESATPTFVAPDMETTMEVVFELEVSDGDLTDTDTVSVTIEPSLAPASFSVSDLSAPASVTQGDPATVTLNITNTGDLEGTQTVDFRLDTDRSETLEGGETLANETVTLGGDENQSVEFEVTTDALEPGTYLHGVVTENDSQTAQLDVTEAPLPANFSVSDLDAPSTVTQGENVTVTANVTNTGGLEGTQEVRFRLDANGDGTLEGDAALASQNVTLDGGETQTVIFSDIGTSGLAPGDYTHGVVTDDHSATATLSVEAQEETLPPVGDFENSPTDPDGDGLYEDINGDGTFDIVDVQALFANLDDETVQDDDNLDAFDFNGDETVDVVDVQKLFTEV